MTGREWQELVDWVAEAHAVLQRAEHRLEAVRGDVVRWAYVKGGDGADSLSPLYAAVMDPVAGRTVKAPPARGTWTAHGHDAQDRVIVVEHHGPGREGAVTHRVFVDGDVLQLSGDGGAWRVERRSPSIGRPRRHVSLGSDDAVWALLLRDDPADDRQAVATDWQGYVDEPPERPAQTLHARFDTGERVVRLEMATDEGRRLELLYDGTPPEQVPDDPGPLMDDWTRAVVALALDAARRLPSPATMLALQYGDEPGFGVDPVVLTCDPVDVADVFALDPADWEDAVWIDGAGDAELDGRLMAFARAGRHADDPRSRRAATRDRLHRIAAALNARDWPSATFADGFLVCPVHIELDDAEADVARVRSG